MSKQSEINRAITTLERMLKYPDKLLRHPKRDGNGVIIESDVNAPAKTLGEHIKARSTWTKIEQEPMIIERDHSGQRRKVIDQSFWKEETSIPMEIATRITAEVQKRGYTDLNDFGAKCEHSELMDVLDCIRDADDTTQAERLRLQPAIGSTNPLPEAQEDLSKW